MKELILDEMIPNPFQEYLEVEEKIIWQGQPNQTKVKLTALTKYLSLWAPGIVLIWILPIDISLGIILSLSWSAFILNPLYFESQTGLKIRFLLSNKRLMFLIPKNDILEFQAIPLSKIEFARLKTSEEKYGTICIDVVHDYLPPRKVINIKKGIYQNQPILEFIENSDKVVELIKRGIRGEL